MKTIPVVLALLVSAVFVRADTVDAILARMNQAAPNFKDLTASVAMDTYEKIIDSHTKETGTLEMQRSKKGDVRAIIAFEGANDARTIAFLGKVIRIYYPKLNTYQDVGVGNSGALVNQFLLLGFGSSGAELAKSYAIAAQGSDKIGTDSTTRLRLTPKDPKVAEKVTQIEIWIPDNGANPVQQKFHEPSGNYRVVTYSNIQLNPPMDKVLDFKLPKGAQKQ